jgi:hypothetical protein
VVSGVAWADFNGDGIHQDDEPLLPGVVVELYSPSGELIDADVTDRDGYFRFGLRPAGDYYLQVPVASDAPNPYALSPQGQGDDPARASAPDPATDRTAVFTLAPAEVRADLNVGLVPPPGTAAPTGQPPTGSGADADPRWWWSLVGDDLFGADSTPGPAGAGSSGQAPTDPETGSEPPVVQDYFPLVLTLVPNDTPPTAPAAVAGMPSLVDLLGDQGQWDQDVAHLTSLANELRRQQQTYLQQWRASLWFYQSTDPSNMSDAQKATYYGYWTRYGQLEAAANVLRDPLTRGTSTAGQVDWLNATGAYTFDRNFAQKLAPAYAGLDTDSRSAWLRGLDDDTLKHLLGVTGTPSIAGLLNPGADLGPVAQAMRQQVTQEQSDALKTLVDGLKGEESRRVADRMASPTFQGLQDAVAKLDAQISDLEKQFEENANSAGVPYKQLAALRDQIEGLKTERALGTKLQTLAAAGEAPTTVDVLDVLLARFRDLRSQLRAIPDPRQRLYPWDPLYTDAEIQQARRQSAIKGGMEDESKVLAAGLAPYDKQAARVHERDQTSRAIDRWDNAHKDDLRNLWNGPADLGMDLPTRLAEGVRRSLPHLEPEARAVIEQWLKPENLAFLGVMAAADFGAHYFGAGEIADGLGLLLAFVFFGSEALNVAGDMKDFAQKTVFAKTQQDLDDAGVSFAKAVSRVAVDALALWALKMAGKGIQWAADSALELAFSKEPAEKLPELVRAVEKGGGAAGDPQAPPQGDPVPLRGGNCFVAGTPLLTPAGDKPIEALRAGDLVLSRSQWDREGPVEAKRVEEVFVRTAAVWELQVGDRVIRTTAEHPFYTRRGWACTKELRAGDLLLSDDGRHVVVEGVRDAGELATVYNVRVADFHTYFVGAREWGFSVWAHNADYLAIEISSGRWWLMNVKTGELLGMGPTNSLEVIDPKTPREFTSPAAAQRWLRSVGSDATVEYRIRPPGPEPEPTRSKSYRDRPRSNSDPRILPAFRSVQVDGSPTRVPFENADYQAVKPQLDAYDPTDQKTGENLGLAALERYLQNLGADWKYDEQAPNGNFDLDRVYLKGDTYYVGEGKGPNAKATARQVPNTINPKTDQPWWTMEGSSQYLRDTLNAMKKSGNSKSVDIANKLDAAWKGGKVKYVQVGPKPALSGEPGKLDFFVTEYSIPYQP